ncbi:MAG: putative drug exporters of the superfamily [Symbiobacteriaceae bacterium]|jgi:RND superfamily putative drug exporter|nr:putative drug exporters of the superfamily [Symbiobacteriaceae bacterium]
MHEKRPRRGSLANWLLAVFWVALLVLAGFNAPRLPSVLTKGDIAVPGSESDQARSLKRAEFSGGAAQTAVLVFSSPTLSVTDPAYQKAAEAIFEQVAGVAGVTGIMSTWDGGGDQLIGRDGRSTFATVEVDASAVDMQGRVIPALKTAVASAPEQLNVYVTGEAAVNYDLMDRLLGDAAKAEKYVIPIILVVLLVIFGTVVAALIPLGLGLVSVAVTMGLFYLYALGNPVHDAAIAVISMIGMGVGVDYALFMVTRFREELAKGHLPAEAARLTVRTSGNAIIFSGATVVVSVASLYLVNNAIIRSLAVAMALVVVVSVLAAVTLLPLLLALLGDRVNRLRVPLFYASKSENAEGFWFRWAKSMMRRPWVFTVAALIPLLVIAYPTIRMQTGSPNISLLPADTGARQGFHVLEEQFSAGTLSPIEVLVQVPQGTVADETNLPKLYALAESIKQDPAVETVVSHVSLQESWSLDRYREIYLTEPAKLSDLTQQLGAGADGLHQAAGALTQTGAGLTQMEQGLRAMAAGQSQGAQGADAMKAGLSQARAAIQQVADGLLAGTGGFAQMSDALAVAESSLAQALGDLQAMQPASKADPRYPAIVQSVATARSIVAGQNGAPGVAAGVRQSTASITQAAAGLQQIAAQLAAVESGLAQMSGGGVEAASASVRLADGLKAAAQGVNLISTEIGKASDGMRTAGEQSSSIDLKPILDRGDMGLRLVTAGGGEQLERLMPTLVNLDRGATVAKMLVIPKHQADAPETIELLRRLRLALPAMAPELQPLVGGESAVMLDMNDQLSWALPRVILLVLVLTFLILLLLMRSILLPLKAVLLNALSVAAAYGTLVLVFQEGHLAGLMGFTPLGFLESPIVVILFAILFGLSMDYEVFLLSRVKEAYDASGNNEESVAVGVEKTASIITGAAAIMVVVFGIFASMGPLTMKELGLGLAVAVFLDASVIRMILAPAFMRLAGDWNWWAPAWLLRILPKIDMQH